VKELLFKFGPLKKWKPAFFLLEERRKKELEKKA
jgi:hypothetical protein